MLYSRPVSSGLDYFINNIKGDMNAIVDKNAGGCLKQKVELGEGKMKGACKS